MELLVTNIVALAVMIFAFAAMACWDLHKFQQCDFSSKKFYQWITDDDEPTSMKRVIVTVAFVGTLAFGQSWMVLALLSLLVLGATVYLATKQCHRPFFSSRQIAHRFVAELALMLLITTGAAFFGNDLETKLRFALYAALLFTMFSYAFAIAVNWLIKTILNKEKQ